MDLYYIKGLLKDHIYRERIARNIPITFYKERPRDVREFLTERQFSIYKKTFPLDGRLFVKREQEPSQPRNYFTVFIQELLTKTEAEEILKFLETQPDFTNLNLAAIDIGEMREFYKFGYSDRLNDNKGEYWRFNYKGTKKVYFKGYADYRNYLEYDTSPNVASDDVERPTDGK